MSTEFVGPFQEYHHVTVDGYKVPRLLWFPAKGANDGTGMLVLDERFGVECSEDEVQKWAWIIANAMAIGNGFSSFGENCVPMNEYKTKMMGISVPKQPPETTP